MIKQLFDSFQPSNYQLSLDVDPQNSSFKGRVLITGKNMVSASSIEIHSKDLVLTSAVVNDREAQASQTENDVLVLDTGQKVPKGETKIQLEFRGEITDQLHGMYPCYFKHDGKEKKLIATQFESHHAREVFPCIDEPAAKATFDLELVTPEGEVVLSNTNEKSQVSKNGRTTTVFETTPKMSTYLLAFVTGEMHCLEAKTKSGVLVRSWATVAQPQSSLKVSVSEGVSYIEFYSDYFGVDYPLEKCDHVALPDFEVGAMENWGLITYRETAMLHDEDNPSLSTRQTIAIVTAHEISHQWFGNLVTMKWWDDLWLNESFASMMEYVAIDAIHPEWRMWEDYVAADCISATNRDVYQDVQPVRVEVPEPEIIHTLFDPSIVYAKGGKLLKTLLDLLGEKAWRAGLKEYFTKHAYGNTVMTDLWDCLSSYSKFDVPEIMENWITMPGQPLIEVEQTKDQITLTQNRLLLDKPDPASSWIVPLISNQEIGVLKKQKQEFQLKSSDWLLLNTTGTGHFIVDYKVKEHKEWVERQVSSNDSLSTWKIARLNELIMLSKNGTTNLTEALDTIKRCKKEDRSAVWSQISAIIGNARVLIEGDDPSEKILKNFTYELISEIYKELGWQYDENEQSNTTHMRSTALALVLASENEEAIKTALKIFTQEDNLEDLPSEIRSLILASAVRFGTEEDFQKLVGLYKTSQNADFKADICIALCSARKDKQIKSLHELVADTKIVKTQDTIRWFAYLMRNKYSRGLTWYWFINNWDWVLKNFGGSKSYDDFARYSAAFMNSEKDLEDYRKFFEPKLNDTGLKRAVQIGLKEIEARVKWRERDEEKIKSWLKEYSA